MTGYSGTPLAKKLGLRAGDTVCVLNAPANFRKLLAPLPDGVSFSAKIAKDCNVVHLFAIERVVLARALGTCRRTLAPDAVVWVSWPKKASGVPAGITEDIIRTVALPLGFVDIKVCAIDETWSGLKLVVRKELR